MFATDVLPTGCERADHGQCSLPAISGVTGSLRAEPKIDRLAHDRGVRRLSACGDAPHRCCLLPRQLDLFALHAIMMALLRLAVNCGVG